MQLESMSESLTTNWDQELAGVEMDDLAVLITIFNDEEALFKALDSIEEPDYSFTVVVVDGGSDRRPEIAPDKYPFKVELIEQETNEGMASGLNEGLDYVRAQGYKFVARLDAGDIQRRGRLAIQYAHLQKSKDLVLLASNAVFKDEDTGAELFVTDLPRTWKQIKKWSVFRSCFIHPTVMIRLQELDPSFKYDTRYPHIEDYVLFTRIANKYPTEIMKEPLLDCFMRQTGTSTKFDRPQLISGIKHHLKHPKPLNPLWYAFIFKRLAFLVMPYGLRVKLKKALKFVKSREPGSTERSIGKKPVEKLS